MVKNYKVFHLMRGIGNRVVYPQLKYPDLHI